MIPAIILQKLATPEGIAELEAGLQPNSQVLESAEVYRGGITDRNPDIREGSVVIVGSRDGKLVLRLEIPAKDGGSSITVIKLRIPTTEFNIIQREMNNALSFVPTPEEPDDNSD